MTHDVFICHSSEDRAVANAICSHLEQNRIRCWVAPRDVLPGSDYAESIVNAITGSKLAVFVFSEHANHSAHVHREIERCVSHGIAILPFRLSSVVPSPALEYFISNAHWLDAMTPPLERHLQHLVETVHVLLTNETPSPSATGAASVGLPPPAVMAPPFAASLAPAGPPPYVPMTQRPRRHTALWWTLGSIGALVVLLAGMAVVISGNDSAGDGDASPMSTNPDITSVATESASPTLSTAVPVDLLMGPVDVLDRFSFSQTMSFAWSGGEMSFVLTGVYVAPADQLCTMSGTFAGTSFLATAIATEDDGWWYGESNGGDPVLNTVPDNDADAASLLAGCPTNHEFWGESFQPAPGGGVPANVDGVDYVAYDMTEMAGSWGEFFGLPAGLVAESMVIRVSTDLTWVAGMDASLSGTAEVFRASMGVPPAGIDGDCRVIFSMQIQRADDPTLVIVRPT